MNTILGLIGLYGLYRFFKWQITLHIEAYKDFGNVVKGKKTLWQHLKGE